MSSNYGYYDNNARGGNVPADPPESSSYGGIGDSVQAISRGMGRAGLHHGSSSNAGNYSYNGNSSSSNHYERGRPAPPPGAGPTHAEPSGPAERESEAETETSHERQRYSAPELHQLNGEADKMKGLGNKHMANQEYTRAYNAYSAALKLSPVGPSSHVYLSNRAAALLSLKRYSAAAVDARRAVALAPTFGKAHARLGQALYFLRDYEGAVAAYEDAVALEPDNTVTWTYLTKARQKLDKQRTREEARAAAAAGDGSYQEEASIDNTTYFGGAVSVATDPNHAAAVVGLGGRGMAAAVSSPGDASGYSSGGGDEAQDVGAIPMRSPSTTARLQNMVGSQIQTEPMTEHGGPPQRLPVGANGSPLSPLGSPTAQAEAQMAAQASPRAVSGGGVDDSYDTDGQHHDPDYDEAVQLQQRATSYLSHKQYRAAVEEYSAALFLVPDDTILSPQLHIGRAHALNGLKRHDSATNDARMAVKINPTSAEAYSVLAKSLFYSRQFGEAVEAFDDCARRMPGGQLSKFDQAYLRKAEDAHHNEEEASLRTGLNTSHGGGASVATTSRMGTGAPVPKLKPPRFVSREQVLTTPSNLPPMPKAWPTQSIGSPTTLQVGPEREVVFFSESMGVKLNRGPDGAVRVISVAPTSAESTIAREGDIDVGDVLREAAGVDLRRPITNVMWGDTVALIKLAPRPIKLIVAPEVSPLPHSVREEMAKESGPPLGVSLTPMAGTPIQQPSANGGNRFDFRGEC